MTDWVSQQVHDGSDWLEYTQQFQIFVRKLVASFAEAGDPKLSCVWLAADSKLVSGAKRLVVGEH